MAGDVRVLGIAETVRNLQQISDQMQRRIIRQATRAAAREIASEVKLLTYTSGRARRTGQLAQSQRVSIISRGDEIRAELRAVYYWWFLERGTAERRQKTTGRAVGAVTARPWVQPTFEADVDDALDVFARTLSLRLDQYCANLPKGPART